MYHDHIKYVGPFLKITEYTWTGTETFIHMYYLVYQLQYFTKLKQALFKKKTKKEEKVNDKKKKKKKLLCPNLFLS